jgi:hypothetical protein
MACLCVTRNHYYTRELKPCYAPPCSSLGALAWYSTVLGRIAHRIPKTFRDSLKRRFRFSAEGFAVNTTRYATHTTSHTTQTNNMSTNVLDLSFCDLRDVQGAARH